MPIKDSAKKELRKTVKRTAYNKSRKNAIKDTIKKIRKAVVANQLDEAKKLIDKVTPMLDKAAKRHIIHPNKAQRTKSRLFKSLRKNPK